MRPEQLLPTHQPVPHVGRCKCKQVTAGQYTSVALLPSIPLPLHNRLSAVRPILRMMTPMCSIRTSRRHRAAAGVTAAISLVLFCKQLQPQKQHLLFETRTHALDNFVTFSSSRPPAARQSRTLYTLAAIPVVSPPQLSAPSFKDALGAAKYRLETILTWNLTAQTIILWSTFFVFLVVGGYLYQKTTGFQAEKAYWRSFCALSGAEPDFSEDPFSAKVVAATLTVIQFLFFAVLVGAVEGSMAAKLNELKGGRTKVYENQHEVILGWNSRLPHVLRQIAIAGKENNEVIRVVVLADEDKDMMDMRIQELVSRGEFRNVVIICRSGDPASAQDQQMVAIDKASKVLILSGLDDSTPADISDNLAFQTALALKHAGNGLDGIRTIVESSTARSASIVAEIGPNITELAWPDLASRHLVKSVLQPKGLVALHRDLLDFDGSELHLRVYKELVGYTVSEACDRLKDSVLLGIVRKDGDILLNASPAEVIGQGDAIVCLAENKAKAAALTASPETSLDPNPVSVTSQVSKRRYAPYENRKRGLQSRAVRLEVPSPKHVVILGWRAGMGAVLHEIDGSVGKGSKVSIVSNYEKEERVKQLRREQVGEMRNCKVHHVIADPCDRHILKRSRLNSIDAALVLLDQGTSAATVRQREARSLETLACLHLALRDKQMTAPRIVAEVMSRDCELIARAENTDIECISLDEFSALLVAQAAYEPGVLPVLRTLLSRGGPELSLRPTSIGFDFEEDTVRYNILIKRGREVGETVLGYVSRKNRIVLNPDKHSIIQRDECKYIISIVGDANIPAR